MLTTYDLAAKLNVPKAKVVEWRKAGMPSGRQNRKIAFDPKQVSVWLKQNGHARIKVHKSDYVKSISELSSRLNRNKRTLCDWRDDPTFPHHGTDGPYHVPSVLEWMKHRAGPGEKRDEDATDTFGRRANSKSTEVDQVRLDFEKERLRAKKLKTDREEGKLVDIELLSTAFMQKMSVISQVLDESIGLLMSRVPEDIPEKVRKRMENDIRCQLDTIKIMFADSLRDDTKDKDYYFARFSEEEEGQ